MIRVGFGYDVHRFDDDRPLILGGVQIPADRGLLGHSDADALLHALTDAVLGAAALGDIGEHFPDTDPQWKGADSRKLLEGALQIVRDHGYDAVNVDATVVMERPKLRPHIDGMRRSIAECMIIDVDAVSVKATTSERMGFVGREEGVAVFAVALLAKRSA
jgi:2-C-methyl-D-erythritol 2,4-cyclodiphosphate synthase